MAMNVEANTATAMKASNAKALQSYEGNGIAKFATQGKVKAKRSGAKHCKGTAQQRTLKHAKAKLCPSHQCEGKAKFGDDLLRQGEDGWGKAMALLRREVRRVARAMCGTP